MQVPKHLVTLTVVIVLCSSGLVLAVPSQVRAATRSTFTVSGVVIDSTGAYSACADG
jgi:cation transport ATPase